MTARKKEWTYEEENLLRDIYPNCSIEQLLDSYPDRSYKCILTKANRLKIRRSKEAISKAISEGNKGKLLGDKNPSKRPEVRKKISEGLKGRVLSQESRDKISKSRSKYKGTNHPLYGKPRSEETRMKIGNSNRKRNMQIRERTLDLPKISRLWLKDEDEKFKKLYPVLSKKELLKEFPNRTHNAINNRAFTLRIRKGKELNHKKKDKYGRFTSRARYVACSIFKTSECFNKKHLNTKFYS